MKTIFACISLLLLMIACLSSCKDPQKQGETLNNIVYDSIITSEIYHLNNDSTKPSCSIKIKYVFPVVYSSQEVLSKIQKELNFLMFEDESYEELKPQDAISKYINNYIENYKQDAINQFPEWKTTDSSDDYYSFYKTIESNIYFNKANLISYQISFMDYKGEATSTTNFRNVVFDLNTGRPLKEDDIFLPQYKDFLNKIFIKKILVQNKVGKVDDLQDIGYLDVGDISPNNNFYVDDKGITYIFNQGEYTIATVGEIKIFLPYNEIKDILKDGSPISILSGK